MSPRNPENHSPRQYYGGNVCVPPLPNSYVEILMPNMMVSGGGTFGRYSGHEGGVLMNGISTLIEVTPSELLSPLMM